MNPVSRYGGIGKHTQEWKGCRMTSWVTTLQGDYTSRRGVPVWDHPKAQNTLVKSLLSRFRVYMQKQDKKVIVCDWDGHRYERLDVVIPVHLHGVRFCWERSCPQHTHTILVLRCIFCEQHFYMKASKFIKQSYAKN